MNHQTVNRASAAALGVILVSVIFAVVAVGLKLTLLVPPIDEERAAARIKALTELRASEEKSLAVVGWVDQSRGLDRLPIETAMRLALQTAPNPAAARAALNARADAASAPAPKAPEKPSAFE